MVTITSSVERFVQDVQSENARAAETASPAESVPAAESAHAVGPPKIELSYAPFPKQQEFHASPAKYRLFGGAAGPGKSKALLMEAIIQAHETPNANTLLLRRTFPELEQTLLHYFRRDVPRELYKSFQESKHLVTWKNGSTTRFGYCQSEHDVYQYQGAEFLFIGIDELTMFTLRQWQFLTSRNRCPVPGTFPCMAAATNPGNIGHAWVKSLWIDKQPAPGMENPAEYDPADYDFIPARVTDNPIYAGDEHYLKSLRALPSHLRRAFLDGDWDVFAGQYFDRFDYTRHVVRAEEVHLQPWWPRWISVDWGFEHPSAVYWHAQTTVEGQGFSPAAKDQREAPTSLPQASLHSRPPERTTGFGPAHAQSRVVSYREYVTRRTPPRELAREIIARSLLSSGDPSAAANREKIDAIYLSPDAFARRTDEASIAEQMGDIFAAAGFPRPIPADDDRVGGWMLMYQMLDAGDRKGPQVDGESSLGDPVWRITENCIELLRTLPNLVRDSARVEDVEKMDGDDPADAARYGLKSRYGAHLSRGLSDRRMPLADRLAARVVSADPTIRAMQARKAQLEETRGAGPVKFPHRRRYRDNP
jgi:phage terminase large subunit